MLHCVKLVALFIYLFIYLFIPVTSGGYLIGTLRVAQEKKKKKKSCGFLACGKHICKYTTKKRAGL
jgi:hypothetical protein